MDQIKANLIENFVQYPAICVVKTAVSTSHKKNQEFHQFSNPSWQRSHIMSSRIRFFESSYVLKDIILLEISCGVLRLSWQSPHGSLGLFVLSVHMSSKDSFPLSLMLAKKSWSISGLNSDLFSIKFHFLSCLL